MQTDTELDRVFAAYPEAVFLLTGLPSPGPCQWRPLVVKKSQRTADGLIVPNDPQQPLTVVENQFRADDDIYRRIAEEMIAAQREFGRDVQGAILFRYRSHDPQTRPWCRIIHSYLLRDLVEQLERHQPQHPLVALFQPVLRTSEATVEREAVHYYLAIRDSDLAESTRAALTEVLISWLVQRLRNKDRKEIEAMLLGELPPLEETQCGRELIEIGVKRGVEQGVKEGMERGVKEGMERGVKEGMEQGVKQGVKAGHRQGLDKAILLFLEAKHGELSAVLRARLERLTVREAERLLAYLPQARTLQDVEARLKKSRPGKSE